MGCSTIPTSNSTYTLQDYATTGQYIKFTKGTQTFRLENRRRINYHSTTAWNSWSNWVYEPDLPMVPDTALLIYEADPYLRFGAFPATGKWNFKKVDTMYVVDTYNYGIQKDLFFFNTVNALHGESVLNMRNKPGISSVTNSYIGKRTAFHVGGDSISCFDVGYNQVFSPWSNPAAPVASSSDSFAVEILGRAPDGGLIVSTIFTNLPYYTYPSKPQYVKVTKQNQPAPASFYPRITWNRNKEPDMSFYKIYVGLVTTPGQDANSYSYLGNTSDTTFVDTRYLLYGPEGRRGQCAYVQETYTYRITAVDNTSKESVKSERDEITGLRDPCAPLERPLSSGNESIDDLNYNLLQNYPNPFNPITKISYSIPNSSFVTLKIYDVTGKEIYVLINELKEAGYYNIDFNSNNLSSGIYYYKIIAGSFTDIKKMIVLK